MQSDNTYRTDFQQDFRFGGKKSGFSEISAAGSGKLKIGKVEYSGTPVFNSTVLARQFKMTPGKKFNFAKSRKGIERLQKFYAKQGYLSARIYLDREDLDKQVNLTVQIVADKKLKIQYVGATIPKSVDKEVRGIWQDGITDRQRADDAERRMSIHFFKQGYPQAKIESQISDVSPDQKLASFHIKRGVHFRQVNLVFAGATPEHADAIAQRLKQRGLADEVGARPEAVADAINLYYRERGYYQAKVGGPLLQTDPAKGTASLVYQVEAGQRLRVGTLRFQGNTTLEHSRLRDKLPLQEGSVLDPDQLKKSVEAIVEKYGENGYRNPEVLAKTSLNPTGDVADLTFVVKEGIRSIVHSVVVQGEDRVGKKYIRDQIRMPEGQPQNVPRTTQSIRDLYNTGAFSTVDVVSVPVKSARESDSGTEPLDVTVKVQEVAPYKFLYGGYYDSGRGPGGIADIESRNILGGARVIGLRGRYDASLQEGRLYFSQPIVRGHPRPVTSTIFAKREDDYYEGLSAERIGFTIQQEVHLQRKLVASYGYRFESVNSWYPDKHAPDPPNGIVAPLTFSVIRNTRDDFLDPTRGSFTSIAFEIGAEFLGSSYGYSRQFTQYFKYFPLRKPGYVPFQGEEKKPRIVFATGARLGVILGRTADQVLPTERFYAGGGTTVRGFKQDTLGPLDANGDPLGGNAMLVLNNELRFPVFKILDGVGFVDIGNVFPQVSDFRFSELRKTAGFGIRLRTPSLLLRFDYGFKLGRRPGESLGAFFFSIGQAY
jgi:outer membrane protein assembly complex protein YaeT